MNAGVFLLLIILTEAKVLHRQKSCKGASDNVRCLFNQSESVFNCKMQRRRKCALRSTIEIAKGGSGFKMCKISIPWNDTSEFIGFRCSCDLRYNLVPYIIRFRKNNGKNCIYQELYIIESFVPPNLTDVKVTSTSSTAIRITANFNKINELPPINRKTVNITFYVIFYKNQNALDVNNTCIRLKNTILNESFDSFQPYTQYVVVIRWKIMDSIYWSEPSHYNITTDAAKPTAAPEIIKGGYSISLDNRIVLYWKKIKNEHVNGPKLQYCIYKVIHCEQLCDWKPISDLKCHASMNNRTLESYLKHIDGSKISAILPKNVQKGDGVMMRSKNSDGISDEYRCIHVNSNDNVFSKITSLEINTVNSTHYHLKWKETGTKNRGNILIYWCRGIYWEIQGWIECQNNIFHKKIPSAAASTSSTLVHIVNNHTHKHEMKMCPRCNLHFGVSMEYNLSSSPIIWNSSMSRHQENLNRSEMIETTIVVSISMVIIIISIGVFYHYKSRVKKFLRGYNITIPKELEKMTESEKLFGEILPKILASSNDKCDDSGHGSMETTPRRSFEYECITPSSFVKKYPSHPILDMNPPMFTTHKSLSTSLPTLLSKTYVACPSPINHTLNDMKFLQSRKFRDSCNIANINESRDYARFGVDCLHHGGCCQDDDDFIEERIQHEYVFKYTGILPNGMYRISDRISEPSKKCKNLVNNNNNHEKIECKLRDNFVAHSETNSMYCTSESSSMGGDNHASLILINQDNTDIYV